jgi:hypothetical protein
VWNLPTHKGQSTRVQDPLLQNICQLEETMKVKVHPRAGHEGPERKWYSSTLSLTSMLDGGGGVNGQRHSLGALPTQESQYPLYRRLVGPKGQSGWVQKISPPPGFDPQTIQPIASH